MAQLKCIYTNARSMGNKQEELEAIVQQAGYDLVPIMKCGGTTLMTGVLQCLAISSSEGTGSTEGGVGWLSILGACGSLY